MKKIIAPVFSLLIGITLNAQQVINIADSNNLFAFKLYDKVKKEKKENLFFSPFSISTALAMTYAGARNETEKQMCHTLHFSLDQTRFNQEYKTYLEKLESDTGKDLKIENANAIWVAKSFPLLNTFSEIAYQDYHAVSQNIDFSNPEQIRNQMNSWVERKTNDKIKDLIQPGILTPHTRVVLVNAIYFKGKWNIPFSKDSTRSDNFYRNNSGRIKTDFMHNIAHYRYYDDTLLQAVELPYAGGKTSMMIFLPKSRNGINAMENRLNYYYYSKIVSSLYSQRVQVALPKFKTTVLFELSKVLSNMGMPVAFSGNTDFSGISDEYIYINSIIHKAFIDVNEEGTEAAAATAIVMKMTVMRPMPIRSFNANHPFIFIIRDNETGSILFMGKIMDPTKE